MRALFVILGLVLMPVAMGQVVEKADPTGYEITLMGVPAEEQARINKVYLVNKNGFVELGEIGKVQVKGKSVWAVTKAIRDACLKAGISEEAIFVMRPITEADSEEASWFLLGSQENKARGKSWQEPLTLFAAVANAGGSKGFGDVHRVRLYRNGTGYTYDLNKDKHKGVKIYPHDLIEVLGTKSKKVESRKFGEAEPRGVNSWKEIQLGVVGVPDADQKRLDGSYKVAEDGTITLWKIGKINTRWKTGGMLATEIAKAYVDAGVYSMPLFVVRSPLRKGPFFTLTIGGQVKKAGLYEWHDGMTLGAAVNLAGGATEFGAVKRVKIYRERKVHTYNLEIEKDREVKVQAKDIVEVPELRF